MRYGDRMQRDREVPIWLKRLDLVRDELRSMRFPRTVEEGVNQCAELSAVSMGLFKEEIRRSLGARNEETVERETRRLMARFSRIDERWKDTRRKECVTSKGQ